MQHNAVHAVASVAVFCTVWRPHQTKDHVSEPHNAGPVGTPCRSYHAMLCQSLTTYLLQGLLRRLQGSQCTAGVIPQGVCTTGSCQQAVQWSWAGPLTPCFLLRQQKVLLIAWPSTGFLSLAPCGTMQFMLACLQASALQCLVSCRACDTTRLVVLLLMCVLHFIPGQLPCRRRGAALDLAAAHLL